MTATSGLTEEQDQNLSDIAANQINGTQKTIILGVNDLATSAWGEQIVAKKLSLGRGLFTYTVPPQTWKKEINGAEVLDTSANAFIFSDNGRLKVTASSGNRYSCRTKRHYRYQPDRGQQYSDAVWLGGTLTNGKLYHVIRTIQGTTVTDSRVEVTAGVDLSKGNVTDGTFQWRGAGDFWGYLNLVEKHHREVLGTAIALTMSNPALPYCYEAKQGAYTYGEVARTGSQVRWGMFTEQNGVFWEFEYADTQNPIIHAGCWDVSSQGGQKEALSYEVVTSGRIQSGTTGTAEQPMIAVRVPTTRVNDNGNTWLNTVDIVLSRIRANAKDESQFRAYYTRDASAITLTAGTWTQSNLTKMTEYILNNPLDATKTFSFNAAKCTKILDDTIPLETPVDFDNPLNGDGPFYLAAGDIIICTHETAGADLCSVTVEMGAEI